jgi:hypothetical protein
MGFTWKRVKSSNRYLYSWTWPVVCKTHLQNLEDADDAGERYLPHEFMYKMLYQAF